MSRRKKVALGLLAVALLAGTGFAVPTIWFKPWKIEHFYLRTAAHALFQSPVALSGMRVLPSWLDWYSDDWDDLSVQHQLDELEWTKRQAEIFRRYDRSAVADQVSYDVFAWFVRDLEEGSAFAWHDYPLNQVSGYHLGLPEVMLNIHRIQTPRDARNYVERLEKAGTLFDQLIESLRAREEKGIVPPRFVLRRVLDQMRDFIEPAPKDHVLYTHLAARLDSLGLGDDERARLLGRTEAAVRDVVYPAYRALIGYVEGLESRATDDAGAWKQPNGDAYYDYLLRHNTTTTLTADELHELGLRELERIQDEMRRILAAEGYPTGDLAAALQALGREERFRWPDSDAGREAILAEYRSILAEAERDLPRLFARLPRARFAVDRVPAFREGSAPAANYSAPSFDGSRPGTFYVNLRDVGRHAKWTMRTLAYHEAVPGHHVQLSVAQEAEDLPFFRRVVSPTAFTEGWALYAEQLAAENGLLPTPYDRLGYLQARLWRAVRLIVDTGIHRKRWTREQAIEFMARNTGMLESEVVAEVERYIVWPGQATAYMVGALEFAELRERAEAALGDRFDLREFHDVVLRNGAVPLVVLEQIVNDWIAREKAARRG